MVSKEPVLLIVLIQTADLRWYVAGIDLEGEPIPLVRSEAGSLGGYIGTGLDDQTSFLRHRLAGILQRGCDRLWARRKKPCQIVFLADGPFLEAAPDLTFRVAEHFVQWMTSPPVVFFTSSDWSTGEKEFSLHRIAGDLDDQYRQSLDDGLPTLLRVLDDLSVWEVASTDAEKS